MPKRNYITSWAILSTWNDCVDIIKMKMISHFQRDEMMYHSLDCAIDDPHRYTTTILQSSLTVWPPMGCLHTSWSSSSGVLSYYLGILTLLMGYATVESWWCGGSEEMQSMRKLWCGSMLENRYSFLEYRYAHLMMRCSCFSLRGSNFLSGWALPWRSTSHRAKLSRT